MANDSHTFHSRQQLEEEGWKLSGNVFHKNGNEYLPLYEAKMVHHFDHRWATYESGKTREPSLAEKQNPDYTVMPRYWIEAREVRLRIANLPKGLLAALRDHDTSLIALSVCRLLFIDWLRRSAAGSADGATAKVFPDWLDFIAYHPFALGLAPIRTGLCGDSPAYLALPHLKPPGPDYLPAVPIREIETGPSSVTAWYKVEPTAVSRSLAIFERYGKYVDSVPPLQTEEAAVAFAEELLFHASPRWLMGCRDVTNSTNERTVVGGVFPLYAVGNNLPVWTTDSDDVAFLPALLSSFACDFAARFKVGGTHLNFFIAEQVSVLPPGTFDHSVAWDSGESFRDWLWPRVLELTYTAHELDHFARDLGWNGPPFRWDEERRFLLRCELDAAFFHLYLPAEDDGDWCPARRADGCPRDETPEQLAELRLRFPVPRDAVAYILDTFPIVRRKDEAEHDEYRTKRVILEIYDEMQQAIRTGSRFRTRLSPPPADPSRCHPPRDHP